MAPHEFVEIRLVCKADYLDPQLKSKLHEIKDKLRQILHTGRRRFALKKVQPWNSVKVTFDIPKEAADRLRLLAVEGNVRLAELGIISVEIVGQSSAIQVISSNTNVATTAAAAATTTAATSSISNTTNSKDLAAKKSLGSSSSSSSTASAAPLPPPPPPLPPPSLGFSVDIKNELINSADHRPKRVKIDGETDSPQLYTTTSDSSLTTFLFKDRPMPSSTTVNLMQPPLSTVNNIHANPGHYLTQQQQQQQPIVYRHQTSSHVSATAYGRGPYTNSISPTYSPTTMNSGGDVSRGKATTPNPYHSPPAMVPPPPPPPLPSSSSSHHDNSTLSNGIGSASGDLHNYHHHDSWSTYTDHPAAYKMKLNGVCSNHYYPPQQQQQQQQPVPPPPQQPHQSGLPDGTSLAPPSVFCTPQQQQQQQQVQYEMRRYESNISQVLPSNSNNTPTGNGLMVASNATSSFDGSSTTTTGLSS